MKEILVTGSEGEVGRALGPQLARQLDAVGFDLRSPTGPLKAVQGGLTDRRQVEAALDGVQVSRIWPPCCQEITRPAILWSAT